MWHYDEFVAKAKLYFSRAERLDLDQPESVLWLLFGLEFLLRAPLARVHPTLLALPEGTSILHAAGFTKPDARPKSVPTKTVVDRLVQIDPNFGEDRGKDALFLADLRNGELHSSAAVLENVDLDVWVPKFWPVAEALCAHLAMPLEDFFAEDTIAHFQAVAGQADRALRHEVSEAIAKAKQFYEQLMPDEVDARTSSAPTGAKRAGQGMRVVECPACENKTAIVWLSNGKSSESVYSDDTDTISYSITHLAESLTCRVCGLSLDSTAAITAAGVDRLYVDEYEEDRYEGWESRMTYEDAMNLLGAGEDYGND